jgi:hypothetical protein
MYIENKHRQISTFPCFFWNNGVADLRYHEKILQSKRRECLMVRDINKYRLTRYCQINHVKTVWDLQTTFYNAKKNQSKRCSKSIIRA